MSYTNYILFGAKSKLINGRDLKLILNDVVLDRVVSTKFLGVIVDEHLNWHEQVSAVACKLSRSVGVLRKLQHKLPLSALMMLYNALIKSHLYYCNIVWGSTSLGTLDCLLKLQKKAVRILSNASYNTHTPPLFKTLRILKVEDINKLQVACFIYNSLSSNAPIELIEFYKTFKFTSALNPYSTRSGNHLQIAKYRLNVRKFCIFCNGVSLWNSLPDSIRLASSIYCLKKLYSDYILNFYC